MNKWGFIGQDTLVALGKSATSDKFEIKARLFCRGKIGAF